MKLITKFFGEKEITENEVITFKKGIPGFEEQKSYVIIKYRDDSPFFLMQAIGQVELALVLIELREIVPSYSLTLNDEDITDLNLEKPEDALLFAVVVIPNDLSKATANLAAPVVINKATQLGKQIILDKTTYSLRHPLFATVEESNQTVAVK